MMQNYYKEWQEFLNQHESISLLEFNDGFYVPSNDTIFMIYDGFQLFEIKLISDYECIAIIRNNSEINLIEIEPFNNIIFSQLID